MSSFEWLANVLSVGRVVAFVDLSSVVRREGMVYAV